MSGTVFIRIPHRDADTAWMEHAACLNQPPELWFPAPSSHFHRLGHPHHRPDIPCPVCICAACPVRTNCLNHALAAHEPDGIWGGLTSNQRKNLHRRQHPIPLATTHTAVCGTEAGWHRHYRLGEQPCPSCRRGAAVARRERRQRTDNTTPERQHP